jgi:hypothetical protein
MFSILIEFNGTDLIIRWCPLLPVAHTQIMHLSTHVCKSVVLNFQRAISRSKANPKLLEQRPRNNAFLAFSWCWKKNGISR